MEARLKEIKKIKPTCPVENISVLHLKNVKANIVTSVVVFFPPLLSITWCRKMGGKCPRRVADTFVRAICWPLK